MIDIDIIDTQTRNDVALCYYSKNGDIGIVDFLLRHGANGHIADNSPLRFAKEEGHQGIVKLLNAHINKSRDIA